MKKLIALIVTLSMMLGMCTTAFAATVTVDGAAITKNDDGTYTVNAANATLVEGEDVANNTQNTIVVISGAEINTSSIQYINQQSKEEGTSFTFVPKDEAAFLETATDVTLTAYIGGDKITKASAGTITYAASVVTKYTVTFKANDAELSSKEYEAGAAIEVPADPTKAEDENYTYTFAGWYDETDAEQTVVNLTDATATKTVTYVAKFDAIAKPVTPPQPATYTVTFMNGAETVATQTYEEGATITAPAAPTKEGFTFLFWGASADATVAADLTVPVSGDATFYAIWEENQSGGEEPQYSFTVNSGLASSLATKPYNITNGKIIRVSGLSATDVVTVTVDGTSYTAKYYTTPEGEIIHIVALVSATEITNDMISHTTGTPTAMLFGDASGDGIRVNAGDVTKLARSNSGYVLNGNKMSIPTEIEQLIIWDVDANGRVNAGDVTTLARSNSGYVLNGTKMSLSTMKAYTIK